jgi:DNA-binding PadR family transcriptional regulator
MSPSDLEVLIHCHAVAGVHPRFDAPAVRDAIYRFRSDGIIEEHSLPCRNEFYTTEKGKAWLEMILRTPMPTEAWIDPRTKEVIER